MASFNTHVSEAQVTIGLITVLYNFSFDCFVTNLLLKNFSPLLAPRLKKSKAIHLLPSGSSWPVLG